MARGNAEYKSMEPVSVKVRDGVNDIYMGSAPKEEDVRGQMDLQLQTKKKGYKTSFGAKIASQNKARPVLMNRPTQPVHPRQRTVSQNRMPVSPSKGLIKKPIGAAKSKEFEGDMVVKDLGDDIEIKYAGALKLGAKKAKKLSGLFAKRTKKVAKRAAEEAKSRSPEWGATARYGGKGKVNVAAMRQARKMVNRGLDKGIETKCNKKKSIKYKDLGDSIEVKGTDVITKGALSKVSKYGTLVGIPLGVSMASSDVANRLQDKRTIERERKLRNRRGLVRRAVTNAKK